MREPVNRTILLLDIERFSRRDDVVQAVLRRTLNTVVDQTLVTAGAEATQQYREDRGDGLIVLLSGDVAKTAVLRALLTVTPELLHDHNRLASGSAQMRLRIVLAAGEVAHDPQAGTTGGLVGHDLNQAFRLLDSDALRDALAARTDSHCVLAVSAPVYEGVVRHGHRGVRPEQFRRTEVKVKDGVLAAWLHGDETSPAPEGAEAGGPRAAAGRERAAAAAPSGHGAQAPPRPGPEPQPQQERPAGAVFHFYGAPVVHGSLVGGDQHGVSGGDVTGDVVLGGSVTKPVPNGRTGDVQTDDGRDGNGQDGNGNGGRP
ncbi:hypothetical protein [Streptomyces albireticuli]|uniref:hypothetical protein n=1 Tax=Streptomyces albireticuli TaxID=1940 RepID=UPI001E29A876|nr:hypothetical protein [Streptomyces albireticuli]MCD9141439.1 hypothetical protein [Streptomyces albireticuli]MCD9160600.1 hypothetical protein [Streptomyces albireticuli]MCD9195844.1 hypothetical protein [Streptomyces albireticuli]